MSHKAHKDQDETTSSSFRWAANLASGHTVSLHVGREAPPNDEYFVLSLAGPLGTLLSANLEKNAARSLANMIQNQLSVWDSGLRVGQRVSVRVWDNGDMESFYGYVTALDANTQRARVQLRMEEAWFPFECVRPLEEAAGGSK
jgi:hypothetical protein